MINPIIDEQSARSDDGPFERYFDEYYKLDCEDVIGDVKCRFGYRKTKRCSYGLTVDEVSIGCGDLSTAHISTFSSIGTNEIQYHITQYRDSWNCISMTTILPK